MLALFFPAASPSSTNSGTPSVAQIGTATTPRTTSTASELTPSPQAGTTLPTSAGPEASAPPGGYPEPETSPLPEGTLTAPQETPEVPETPNANEPQGAPTIEGRIPGATVALPLPTFNPERPTATVARVGPTTAGGAAQQTAYPAPQGATNTPTDQLINPPTFTPVTPPTPVQPPTFTPPSAALPPPAPTTPPPRRPTPPPPP